MLINLSELFTCEGKKKGYDAEIGLTEVSIGGEDYRVVSAEPFQLTVTNTGDRKYFLEGSTKVTVEIPCSRCLEPVAYVCELTLDRELETDKPEAGQAEDLDEQPYLSGYNLDVDQLALNEILIGLPMKVLCREDCKGICNRCGTNLNYGTCTCDRTSLDPRMAVIQDIYKQFKEV